MLLDERLLAIIEDAQVLAGPSWRTTATYHIGDGAALLAGSRQQRVEGLVSKRAGGSKYVRDRRLPCPLCARETRLVSVVRNERVALKIRSLSSPSCFRRRIWTDAR